MRRHRLAMTGLLAALLLGQGCHLAGLGSARLIASTATQASGLVASNAGTLSGLVQGPGASVLANNAGSLIANNGGGLISNNGSGLVANNGGGLAARYATLAADARLVPVAGAEVTITDLAGQALSSAPVTTDAAGRFTLKGLRPSGPIVVVHVHYRLDGRDVSLQALVDAPRKGARTGEVSPATTLVAKKVRALGGGSELTTKRLTALTAAIAQVMGDRAIAIAALAPDAEAVAAFDRMTRESDAIGEAARAASPTLATSAGTPAETGPAPSPSPDAGASPAPITPSASPSTSHHHRSSTPTPSPSPTPRLLRIAGASVKGYTEATGGDLTTARFNEFAGMAYDGTDTLYVCDESGSMVRALHLSSGTSECIAGSATGTRGFTGDGGPADQALLDDAHGIAIGPGGELFVCDKNNLRIRVIHADKTIDTIAGGGAVYGDGPGTAALLGQPQGIAPGPNGTMFFTMRTSGSGFENVVRLNADGTITLLTDKSLITSPGAIAVDAAKHLVYFTNNSVVKLLRNADGVPGAPEDVFTLPASGNPAEVRGLALDPAGTLYMASSDYSAVNNDYGAVNAHLYALPLGADGLATGPAVAIAGTGGSSATEADYDVPATGVMDPLTQLLSGGGSGMLTMGPTGTLFIGHTYKVPPKQWTEILQLKL